MSDFVSAPNTSREGLAELEREIQAEMIKAINRALRLDPGPTRAAHRTAAAEYAAILLALSNKTPSQDEKS